VERQLVVRGFPILKAIQSLVARANPQAVLAIGEQHFAKRLVWQPVDSFKVHRIVFESENPRLRPHQNRSVVLARLKILTFSLLGSLKNELP